MIEKMKYINITGHLSDIDRIIERYVARYEIHLENAMKELRDVGPLEAVNMPNPYAYSLKIAERFVKRTNLPLTGRSDITKEGAYELLEKTESYFNRIAKEVNSYANERKAIEAAMDALEPFRDVDFNLEDIRDLNYIKCKFGKMPVNSYEQFKAFMYNKKEILFIRGKADAEYVWCVYFTADESEGMADSMFSFFHFKELKMVFSLGDMIFKGKPSDVYYELKEKHKYVIQEAEALEEKTLEDADIRNEDIVFAYNKMRDLYRCFEQRKFAAHTKGDYCIFVGWIPERLYGKLSHEMEGDEKVILVESDGSKGLGSVPPTKLNNFPLFRPFEMFVKMYGLPSYNEYDPTAFVAITYTIIFGMMFGDLGQGFLLSLLGIFLFKVKGLELGKVMSIIGVSSMVFGCFYGSVFGYEHLIPTLWMKPAETTENTTAILFLTVGIGMGLIIFAMCLNVFNLIRNKDYSKLIFDPNGIAGLVFYLALLVILGATVLGNIHVALAFILIFLVVPVILIAFREPIIRLIQKKKNIIHGSIGMFLMETVIEMFEVLLSYMTNTISFVRVGAFALSHAGMMSVVMMLSETADGGNNLVVVIIGNLLVMALEGLVVGIQVLRLEFYEMFSRFFKGEGRMFKPFKL